MAYLFSEGGLAVGSRIQSLNPNIDHRRWLTCSVRVGLQLAAASSSCLKRVSLKEALGVEGLQPVGVAN